MVEKRSVISDSKRIILGVKCERTSLISIQSHFTDSGSRHNLREIKGVDNRRAWRDRQGGGQDLSPSAIIRSKKGKKITSQDPIPKLVDRLYKERRNLPIKVTLCRLAEHRKLSGEFIPQFSLDTVTIVTRKVLATFVEDPHELINVYVRSRQSMNIGIKLTDRIGTTCVTHTHQREILWYEIKRNVGGR